MPVGSRIARTVMLACLLCWELGSASARAQGLSLLRDSEIEDTIRLWTEPVVHRRRPWIRPRSACFWSTTRALTLSSPAGKICL